MSLNCPGNHTLTQFRVPTNNYQCDVCRQRIAQNSFAYGCRKCDWDVCENCYNVRNQTQTSGRNRLETQTQIHEAFVFSMDRKEFLRMQIQNTHDYYYYTLLDAMKGGKALDKQQQKLLSQYRSEIRTVNSKGLILRDLFMQYDTAKTQKEREEIIKTINEESLKIKFDHTQPGNIQGSKLISKKSTYPTKIDGKQFELKGFIEKAYSKYEEFAKLKKSAYVNFEIEKLLKVKDIRILNQFLRTNYIGIHEKIVDLIVYYYKLKQKKSKHYSYENWMFKNLTYEQLQKLGKKVPQITNIQEFYRQTFLKLFETETKDYQNTNKTPKQRRAILKKIYNHVKNFPKKFSSFRDIVLIEIMVNGIETNIFDYSYFELFLKYSKDVPDCYNEDMQKKLRKRDYNYDQSWC